MSAAIAQSGTTHTAGRKPKRSMTIEQAVSWAFREELPKHKADRPIAAAPTMAVHPMWRAGVFGGRIDNWNNHDPGFPLAMGEPHPDAILIGNAVKGCDVERLDLWDFLIPYKIGDRYDQGAIIEKARRETVAVITNCATSRTRPDTSDRVTVEAVRSITGQITVWVDQENVYEDAQGQPITVKHPVPTGTVGKKKGVYPNGAYCKIIYNPSAATVALDRARYAGWYAGLTHIAELLRVMGLQSIEITGLDAPRMPWIDAPAPVAAPNVVKSLLAPQAARHDAVAERPTPTPVDDVEAHTLRIRTEVLKERRGEGRRQRPRRHSEVRSIDPRSYRLPAETA